MTQSAPPPTASSPGCRRWVAIPVILVLVCVGGLVLVLFTSCSTNKYLVGAGLPKPDRAFQTGTVHGYDVYIWDCYQNQHIVLYHTSAEMTSGPYARQQVACGELAPIEIQLANEKKRELDPSRFW